MLNMKQSDCRFGGVGFAAGEDLSLKAGCLVKLNSGGDLVLPSAASDITPYVVICGADTGYLCGAVPLTSSGNCRIKLSGTCEAGDLLVSKGDGRVEKGTELTAGLNIGTAEEAGVDGQLVLLRPVSVGSKGADGQDGADGADGAPGEPGTAGAAGAAGATGPAGADGDEGYIGAWQVLGSLWGSGQVLFFGTDGENVERWASAPVSLGVVRLMALVTEVVDPSAADVLYRLKLLAIAGVSNRSVTVPLLYVGNTGGGISLWSWIDAVPDGGHEGTYALQYNAFTGLCGGVGLRVATSAGTEVVCVSEVSV